MMYRILIADDEEYVRDLLVKNILKSSLDVDVVGVAGDGNEALNLAFEKEPDILITDISMPFRSGLELIKEMQLAGLHSKNVVISGYDEFDYARQAISLGVKDYLLKPFLPKELTDVLHKMIQELDSQKALQQNMSLLKEQAQRRAGLAREKALKTLLNGRECPEEQETQLADLGINLDGTYYLSGIMRLSSGSWDFGSQENVEEFLMLIREGYFPEWIHTYAVSFDGIQLAVIWCGVCNKRQDFIQMIHKGLEKILLSLEKYYHIQLQCAVGSPYTSEKDLEKSYREAMAVWRGMLSEEKPILFFGDSEVQKEENINANIGEWKNQIRILVRVGQAEDARIQLQGLMKCYASLSNKKNDYISISIGELVYAIQNDMENAGYGRGDTEPLKALNDRIRYGSLMDMREMLETYITDCCHVIVENSEETRAGSVVEQVKMLIEHNIRNEDLDLEWVSDRVHFSSSYVRQIFKQHTQEGFGEYLIRKRMEKAGKLLQNTNLRIQEIADECGYENQRYFASSFKKFYGCTPTEFKKTVERDHLY